MKHLLTIFVCVCGTSAALAAPAYQSPVAIAATKDGSRLFVAAATGKRIVMLDLKTGKPQGYPLAADPSGLTLSPDGKTLFVTTEGPSGQLVALRTSDGKPLYSIPVGHFPTSPVCSSDGSTVYLCNRFANSVRRVDVSKRKVVATIAVTREPVALAISPSGKRLFVANHLPVGRADGERIAAAVDVIELPGFVKRKPIELVNGTFGLQSMAFSADGKRLYVPATVGRYSVPTTQLDRGWMNTSSLNVIDVEKERLYHTVLLDDVDRGAANPWGVACTPGGRYVCVSHSGTHEVSVIDAPALLKRLKTMKPAFEFESLAGYERASGTPVNRLDGMVDVRQRVSVKGKGPRGIVAIGQTVYAANYFSDSVSEISCETKPEVKTWALGKPQTLTLEREGEIHFYDAGKCYQQWQSCATCHPGGRADALNWDLLNDGMGNPKNTRSLLLSHETPPVMISGIRPDAKTAVRAGIKYILFAPSDEKKAKAIDAYLKSMKPVPSPYLENGRLSAAAERGKKVFSEANCAMCHSGPLFTDKEKHDIGTGIGQDAGKPMDTPQLIELWRTAPYLLDGRAATLKELLTTFNADDNHGTTSTLSEKEIKDLITYLNSL